MSPQKILKIANWGMLLNLVAFILCAFIAYRYENNLPLMLVTVLHVAQMFLAGFFKVSYVVRLVSQKQLGQLVR